MIWLGFSLAGVSALASVVFFVRAWKESRSDDSIGWKWCSRLIWLGNIVYWQGLELQRYLEGLPYRPFHALFGAALFGAYLWVIARMAAGAVRPR
jgi:hypothetical protein